MKACVLLTLLALCCPLAVVADDLEFDDSAMIGAMIVGSMMGVSSFRDYDDDAS